MGKFVCLVFLFGVGVEAGKVPPEVVELKLKLVEFVGLSIPKQEGEFIVEFEQKWEDESNANLDEDDDLDSFPSSSGIDRRFSLVENGTETGTWTPKGSIGLENFRSFQVQAERIKIRRKSGLTVLTQRVKASVACELHLGLFPFDSHLCSLIFSSSGGGNFSSPPQICGSFHAYQFYLKGYSFLNIPSSRHQHDKLNLFLIISRTSTMQVFGQMYSPLIMLVGLSFFTLSIGPYPFRIAASSAFFLCLLVITSLFWRDIPRMSEGSSQTAIEHYFAFAIGFSFQIVMTNILMFGYLSKKPQPSDEGEDVEANKVNGNPVAKTEAEQLPPNFAKGEEHICKMGGWHKFVYFKCLKPTKTHLPIGFLIFNIIYWPIVLFLSSGLPNGFLAPTPLDKCL
ncbi:Glutamate-gated chloride channel [Orchesella cincta]|uniref:Glutamate-gated chloride channel n=1 Tax=Orchesella cincta TaxID=48709 RepID=A0A1D2MFD5_ORCCI|nr:Glutamate-gated chloride channel [Orchesella cincta]